MKEEFWFGIFFNGQLKEKHMYFGQYKVKKNPINDLINWSDESFNQKNTTAVPFSFRVCSELTHHDLILHGQEKQ